MEKWKDGKKWMAFINITRFTSRKSGQAMRSIALLSKFQYSTIPINYIMFNRK